MNKVKLINQAVEVYFKQNKFVLKIAAKDLMPQFVTEGIFPSDNKDRPGKPLRDYLRKLDSNKQLHLIPNLLAERKEKNTYWYFQRTKGPVITPKQNKVVSEKVIKTNEKVSKNQDEDYVLNLCDEVLNQKGSRQHKFDFLVGDSGRKLPVDSFYPSLKLVIEYREYQHTNEVKFFDKPDKITVSGVSRGEQRKIYDKRRRDVLPQHEIQLVEIDYSDFECDSKNRIIRNREKDLAVVRGRLKEMKNTIA